MQIDRTINNVKEFSLWIYAALMLAGIIYAASMGYEAETPGEIFYRITHQ